MSIPYDRTFKILADDDPRAAMAAFAGIPLDADIEVQPVDRELNISTLRVDNLCRCRQDGVEFLVHFEAVSRYKAEALDHEVDYVRAIIAKYKLQCRSYMLLLTEGGVPERLPRYLKSQYGDYDSRVRLRAVRLWKIPARRILQMDRLALLPWTALMAGTPAEFAESWRRLVSSGDRNLPAQMALLRGLRYGKKEVSEEGSTSMTTEEILEHSSVYQWILEKGEKIGVEKGEKIGVRHTLMQLLTARFGQLPPWAEERIAAADAATLDRWSIRVLTASSLEDCVR
ncbi:MAG: hypothetical protein ACKV2U_02675 [Bryobacteraceae bacterium]